MEHQQHRFRPLYTLHALLPTIWSTKPATAPDTKLLEPHPVNESVAYQILRRYNLGSEVPVSAWDYTDALAGNYFHDNPTAS